jgi:Fe-S oxidoreductase
MNTSGRMTWIEEVEFPVRVFGMNGEDKIPADVEYLFWVGCAGAYDDRAKRTTKAVAELLHTAGIEFMVLGEGETCTGDPARRAGNEFLYQMQAAQNVEVLNEIGGTCNVRLKAGDGENYWLSIWNKLSNSENRKLAQDYYHKTYSNELFTLRLKHILTNAE